MVLTAFVLLSKWCRLLFLVISSLVSCRVIRHLSATHCFPIRLAWILLFFSVLREKAKTSCPINNEPMDFFFLIIANFPFNLRWQHSVAKQVVNPVLVIEKFCVVHHCLEKGRSRAVASASCSAYFIWAFWLQLDGGWRASELALSPDGVSGLVFLDLDHWVTFLKLHSRRAVERCILILTLVRPPKECKQVFVAYLKIWKQNFCYKFMLISKLTSVQIICIPLGGYLCCKFTKDWSQSFWFGFKNSKCLSAFD